MIHAEVLIFWNTALCACSLPLGGKLAGMPMPTPKQWGYSVMIVLLSSFLIMATSSFRWIALLGLPLCTWCCFGQKGLGNCFRCMITTLCASLLLGGTAQWLWASGLPIVPSLMLSMALSMMLYLLATLLPMSVGEVRQVELCHQGRSVILPAMLDSGNLLRDPITGLPVVVVPQRVVRHTLFPFAQSLDDLTVLPMGFRLLSVRTAAGTAMMPMFHPDVCKIHLSGKTCQVDLLVALGGANYAGVQALVPTSALASPI